MEYPQAFIGLPVSLLLARISISCGISTQISALGSTWSNLNSYTGPAGSQGRLPELVEEQPKHSAHGMLALPLGSRLLRKDPEGGSRSWLRINQTTHDILALSRNACLDAWLSASPAESRRWLPELAEDQPKPSANGKHAHSALLHRLSRNTCFGAQLSAPPERSRRRPAELADDQPKHSANGILPLELGSRLLQKDPERGSRCWLRIKKSTQLMKRFRIPNVVPLPLLFASDWTQNVALWRSFRINERTYLMGPD
ncbi:hypothetical protein FN846DRAFT_889370 [Sphaerosporella brunnea]|uniref:Uncharacterized protein n=1 Tax=Sphaerosporella brunnea TaxID=1250544 RepID=A0A5J5EZM3_9PEZI|nr:hypothetical protein FN846DRAFT_889370 [Sphaerosporella brunnea]